MDQTTLAVSEVNEAVQKQTDIILSINSLIRQFKTAEKKTEGITI